MLGVRRSDAVAFCQWLNQRDPGAWHYRLPHTGEHDEKAGDGKEREIQTEGMGFWTVEGGFVWLRKPPHLSVANEIQALYMHDRFLLHMSALLAFLDYTRASARVLYRASARASARDHVLASASVSVSALDLDLASASVSTLDLDLYLASASTIAHDIANALDRNCTTRPAGENRDDPDLRKKTMLLRSHIRLSALFQILVLQTWLEGQHASRTWRARLFDPKKSQLSGDDFVEQVLENFLLLYKAFALLELRIQGKLPAWEGILLMKERQRDQ